MPAPTPFQSLDFALTAGLSRRPFVLPWSLGSLLALMGYAWVFWLTTDMPLSRTVTTSFINAGTAWAIGLTLPRLLDMVVHRAVLVQALTLIAAAAAYSLVWYVCTISLLAWRDGSLLTGTVVMPFRGVAFVWQIFQGFALFGSAASLAVAARILQRPIPAADVPTEETPIAPRRLLIRSGDELSTLDVDEIVLVTAADDYVEISTVTARHLVRRSLGALEAELPTSFLRIHRSALVNLERLVRAEPAGAGRMTLHLEGGHSAVASKTGARALRERTI